MHVLREMTWDEIHEKRFSLINRELDFVDNQGEIRRAKIRNIEVDDSFFKIDLAYVSRLLSSRAEREEYDVDEIGGGEIEESCSEFKIYVWNNGEISFQSQGQRIKDQDVNWPGDAYTIRPPMKYLRAA